MTDWASPELARYRNPPVVEVVLSTAFEPIRGLGVLQVGDLWKRHFADLSKVEEKPPIEMAIERFDSIAGPSISFEMVSEIPIPRLWFQNPDGTQLVQLQNNFLARNWRKSDGSSEYPRYPSLRTLFENDLGHLASFVSRRKLGAFLPTQCEITYINHVPGSSVAGLLAFVDDIGPGSLPAPDGTSITVQFVMRQESDPIGRLHVQVNTARSKSTGEPLVVLTITARGRPLGSGPEGVLRFLDEGRLWARRAFDSLTSPEMQGSWGKAGA